MTVEDISNIFGVIKRKLCSDTCLCCIFPGAIFAAIFSVDTFMTLIGQVAVDAIYRLTVSLFPGFVFLMFAALLMVSAGLIVYVYSIFGHISCLLSLESLLHFVYKKKNIRPQILSKGLYLIGTDGNLH